jgi:hypothetical protein
MWLAIKVHLDYGENCVKLVRLRVKKKYFSFLKHPNLAKLCKDDGLSQMALVRIQVFFCSSNYSCQERKKREVFFFRDCLIQAHKMQTRHRCPFPEPESPEQKNKKLKFAEITS